MKIILYPLMIMPLLISGCENRTSQLQKFHEVCNAALKIGDLITAEDYCQQALGNIQENVLDPKIKSDRLYHLARIKRQRNKYDEAEELLQQSIAIEKILNHDNKLANNSRLIEMVIILAGQRKWREGAESLLKILSDTTDQNSTISDQDRSAILNVVNVYTKKLSVTHQSLAVQLEEKAKVLK